MLLNSVTRPKKKKKEDALRELVFNLSLSTGFGNLNVLVIGDSRGFSPIGMSGANSYFFTKVERTTFRARPFESLADYEVFLLDQFDVVISKTFNEGYARYCHHSGLYISMVDDVASLEQMSLHGLIDKQTGCVLISRDFSALYEEAPSSNFLSRIRNSIADLAEKDKERVYIPNMENLPKLKPERDSVTLTAKGIKSTASTGGLLNLYNSTLSIYNTMYTTYTGVIDAFHRFPSTAFVDFGDRLKNLEDLGFTGESLKKEETAQVVADRIKKRYEFLTTPLMPLLPQQALAYVKEGSLKAKEDVDRLGIVKGKKYQIRVGWQKRRDNEVKRGFMTVKVNGFTLFEDRQVDVEDFIRAFGLPKIGSMETIYPEVVNVWRGKIKKMFPRLVDFQQDDLALAACKPNVYFAHDRGMGKTLMSAAWAQVRGYSRVLVTAQRQYLDKWAAQLEEFGFAYEWLLDWNAVSRLKERIKAKVKNPQTVFYLCSFEFLGLENDQRIDPWTCVEKDKGGYIEAVVKEIRTLKCPSCGKTVGQARSVCPHCGSTEYSGKFCQSCRKASYSFIRSNPLTPEKCYEVEARARAGAHGFHSGTYPAYRKLKKLFPAVLVDEAQMVKNKQTLRSTAVRSLHSKGRALMTANLMKNWPNELFWPVSWLLGFNNPMFPYQYIGGYPFFERQFGTQIFRGNAVDGKEMWDRIPEVSNLTILWKLMAPFMVRRLKTDIEGAPEPHIEPVLLAMDDDQQDLYMAVRQSKLDELSQELQKDNPDARIIGANLWSLRAASTIPVAQRYFPQISRTYQGTWGKAEWLLKKVKEIANAKQKVIIYTTLTDMAAYMKDLFDRHHIRCIRIQQSTKNRFEVIEKFNVDATTVLISSTELIGRCYDIPAASYVIFTDVGWTPEEHEQGMDRAQRILLSMDPITVYFLLNANTIDEHMYELVIKKGEAIKNVLDRRAVYQPANALREAIQVQVAKKILSERYEKPIRIIASKTAAVVQQPEPERIYVPVDPILNPEQLSLFGACPVPCRQKRAA